MDDLVMRMIEVRWAQASRKKVKAEMLSAWYTQSCRNRPYSCGGDDSAPNSFAPVVSDIQHAFKYETLLTFECALQLERIEEVR